MVKSADRVGQILILVGQNKYGLRHAQIATALSIPTSSLSMLLASLVDQDLLILDKERRKYLLGPLVIELAGRYIDNFNLIDYARPVVQRLAKLTGESAILALRVGWNIITAYSEESRHVTKQFIPLNPIPMYVTASGKALLAHMQPEELKEYLSSIVLMPLTPKTITDQQIFSAELEAIRATGFAYSREEQHIGIIAVSTPVFDLYRKASAALTISLPVKHFTEEKENQVKRSLKEASDVLSRKLGSYK